MRVTADHRCYPGAPRVYVEIVDGVHHIEELAALFDRLGLRELCTLIVQIDVAPYRCCWSDLTQFVENFDVAHIASVKDMVNTARGSQCLGTQETVRV